MKKAGWRTLILGIALVAVVASVIAVAAKVDERRSYDSILECFNQMKSLIDAERYNEAYLLSSPVYREDFDLTHFQNHEGWRGDIRNEALEISSFFGRATVRSRDPQGYWTMGFRRVEGQWYYDGSRGYFHDWL